MTSKFTNETKRRSKKKYILTKLMKTSKALDIIPLQLQKKLTLLPLHILQVYLKISKYLNYLFLDLDQIFQLK